MPRPSGDPRWYAVALVAGLISVASVGVFSFVLYETPPPPPPSCACGVPFTVGNAILSSCPSGATFAAQGCVTGDFVYTLNFESSTKTFGEVQLRIRDANGSPYMATGGDSGFSIINLTGKISAQWSWTGGNMTMESGSSYLDGTNASTPLTNLYTLEVDMGVVNPLGKGYSITAILDGGMAGTSSTSLP